MKILFAFNAVIYLLSGIAVFAAMLKMPAYRRAWIIPLLLCIYYSAVYFLGLSEAVGEIAIYTRSVSWAAPITFATLAWLFVIIQRGGGSRHG